MMFCRNERKSRQEQHHHTFPHLSHSNPHTIIALINTNSGSFNSGKEVLETLSFFLPNCCYDISLVDSKEILSQYVTHENLRIIVGGGDGTVSSILHQINLLPVRK
jgi:diacylglycerol kinase family enzyme